MWNTLYELWRSVLKRAPTENASDPSGDDPPRSALREDLRLLLEKRAKLQSAAASYREFGYDDLACRARDEVASTDRQIQAARRRLRRRQPATG